jgi:hypothetical protein
MKGSSEWIHQFRLCSRMKIKHTVVNLLLGRNNKCRGVYHAYFHLWSSYFYCVVFRLKINSNTLCIAWLWGVYVNVKGNLDRPEAKQITYKCPFIRFVSINCGLYKSAWTTNFNIRVRQERNKYSQETFLFCRHFHIPNRIDLRFIL